MRCDECLRPPKIERVQIEPQRVTRAIVLAAMLGGVWMLVLGIVGYFMGSWVPSMVVSSLAGLSTGRTIWQSCGKTHNRLTVRWAAALGAGVPVVAGIVLLATFLIMSEGFYRPQWFDIIRILLAAGLGALFAWMVATHQPGERKIFDR